MAKKINFSDFDHIPISDVFKDIRESKAVVSDLKSALKEKEDFVELLIGIIKYRRDK